MISQSVVHYCLTDATLLNITTRRQETEAGAVPTAVSCLLPYLVRRSGESCPYAFCESVGRHRGISPSAAARRQSCKTEMYDKHYNTRKNIRKKMAKPQ